MLLYCIEYRNTDIGPYNEVGLTVLATAPGDPIPANYVVNLPVTTAVASRIGREIWGYNKFVAAIDVKSDGKSFSTILRDTDAEMIGSLEGRRGASVPTPPTDILTFTLHQGRLIKTVIRVLTPSSSSSGENFVFKIGTSRSSHDDQFADGGARWSASGAGALRRPVSGIVIPGRDGGVVGDKMLTPPPRAAAADRSRRRAPGAAIAGQEGPA